MEILEQTRDGKSEFLLRNPFTGEQAAVLSGGQLAELVLAREGRLHSLIYLPNDDHWDNDGWRTSALLFPWPSRIRGGQYAFEEKTYQLPINDGQHNAAIHGFVHGQELERLEHAAHDDHAVLKLGFTHPGDYPGYPFPFQFTVTYTLRADGRFELGFEVENTGNAAMPVALGWHPYWRFAGESTDDWTLHFDADAQLLLDEDLMPTGIQPLNATELPLRGQTLDAAFRLRPNPNGSTTRLHSPLQQATLHLWQPQGPGQFNYLVVFTPGSRGGVAIEPLTAGVDAFNNGEGLLVLPPGQTHTTSCHVWLSE